MEIHSTQKYVHMPARKLRLVADSVRAMKPLAAVNSLKFVNKAAAQPIAKAISTALANAKMQNLDAKKLVFKKLEINEGQVMKRFRAGTKGRIKRYTKRTSHINIVLSEAQELVNKQSQAVKNSIVKAESTEKEEVESSK